MDVSNDFVNLERFVRYISMSMLDKIRAIRLL